jgi:hypothetical protein
MRNPLDRILLVRAEEQANSARREPSRPGRADPWDIAQVKRKKVSRREFDRLNELTGAQ